VTGGGSVLRIEGLKHSNLKTGLPMSQKPISPLRQRMLEDMSLRGFTPDTQRDYIRAVKKLPAFLGRSPDTATAEDLRAFQLHLSATAFNHQPSRRRSRCCGSSSR
jgi:Phage integrase, N-terminal SAM-like domain